MNAKISVFVICVETIMYLLLCNLNDPNLSYDSGKGCGRVVPKTLHKLPKNWVIYIEDNVY